MKDYKGIMNDNHGKIMESRITAYQQELLLNLQKTFTAIKEECNKSEQFNNYIKDMQFFNNCDWDNLELILDDHIYPMF